MNGKRFESHPGVAAVLSFLFNGLGQLYNGEIKKGLVIMTLTSASLIVIVLGAILMGHWLLTFKFPICEFIIGAVTFILGIVSACVIGIYSISDAYRQAAKK